MTTGETDIQLVLAEMKVQNTLTAELVKAQLITATAAEEAAIDAKKASDYAEQRLAVERGFFMDVGSLVIEVRAANEMMRGVLNQTPVSGELTEFTELTERAVRHINERLEVVLLFMLSATPHLSTMGEAEQKHLTRQLKKAVSAPKLESLKAQQKEWQASLHTLLEQEAIYGGVPPVDLVNRMSRAKLRLEELEVEMETLKNA
jgi:hypothetical protein